MEHITKIKVRYAETDRMGVTHHANYLIYYEQARTEFSEAMGFSYRQCEELGLLSPVLEVRSQYRATCTYDDELAVRCWLNRISQTQMEFSYEIRRLSDGQVVNTGCSRHCWVDAKTFRPASLKRRAPEVYELFLQQVSSEPPPCKL